MEIILEIIIRPFVGAFGGLSGILWPTEDAEAMRLQRMCKVTLAIGVAFLLAAILSYYVATGTHVFASLVVAWVLFIISGVLGGRIEKICKAESQKEVNETKDRNR
jgi:hypothetical protein